MGKLTIICQGNDKFYREYDNWGNDCLSFQHKTRWTKNIILS